MPKLAIYIPKKDMREIERWRKTINFSKVFMRALRHEIREQTRRLGASDDQLASAARYYRQQLAASAEPLVDYGFQTGAEDVIQCRLAPDVIQRLLALCDVETLDAKQLALVESALGDRMPTVVGYAKQHGFDDQTHPTWRSSLCAGYVKGVAKAWKQICEQMKTC